MKIYKYLYILSLAMIFCISLSVIYLFYLLFVPVKAIDIQVPPTGAEIVNDQPLQAGESIYYKLTFCNYTKPNMQIVYSLISFSNDYKSFIVITRPPHASVDNFQDSKVGAFDPCSSLIDGSVKLPDNIPDGEYILGANIVTQVNSLRKQSTFFETEPFIVKGGEEE